MGVIVSETAGFKKVIDPEMPQFDPRTFDVVAREQAEVNVFVMMQLIQKFSDSRKQFTRQSLQAGGAADRDN